MFQTLATIKVYVGVVSEMLVIVIHVAVGIATGRCIVLQQEIQEKEVAEEECIWKCSMSFRFQCFGSFSGQSEAERSDRS